MHLYHKLTNVGFNAQNNIINNGLNSKNQIPWYGIGGKLFVELTEELRPNSIPNWVDFKKAIAVELKEPSRPYFEFPLFTDKIVVFDGEISSEIFGYTELDYLKMSGDISEDYIDYELIPLDILIRKYWSSMTSLDTFKEKQGFKCPEILLFEGVPKEIIKLIQWER